MFFDGVLQWFLETLTSSYRLARLDQVRTADVANSPIKASGMASGKDADQTDDVELELRHLPY